MIQKNIFFIWVGDNKPNYVDFSVSMFREVNPEFKVKLVEWSVEDIEKLTDMVNCTYKDLDTRLLHMCCREILYNLNNKIITYHRRFIQLVVNKYRFYLIRTYGGIYLDCDTFPIRPFDDELLSADRFTCSTIYKTYIETDGFFQGLNFKSHNPKISILYPNINGDKVDQKMRADFFNCKLKYGTFYNDPKYCYIEHFCDRTWIMNEKCRTPMTKMDYRYDK